MSEQFPKYESPMFFHLFRDEDYSSLTNGVTICAVPIEVGSNKFSLGYSMARIIDSYNKKKGRIISESRARSFKSFDVIASDFKGLHKEVEMYASEQLTLIHRAKFIKLSYELNKDNK